MNWNRRKPTEAGLYLAKLKGSKEVVAVVVTFWERVPHGDQRRGYYAKSWTGENCHVSQGAPYAIPMSDRFSEWALAHPFVQHNAIGEARADNASPPHDQTF